MGATEDWFDNLDFFGTKKTERANAQQKQGQAQNDAAFAQAQANAAAAEGRASDSYKQGTNYANQANDWIQTGGQSGKLASQGAASAGGIAGGTARSLGMNAAQAAKQGGQTGAAAYGDIYRNVYGQGMQGLSNLSGQYLGSSAAQGGVAAQNTGAQVNAANNNLQSATGQQTQGAGQTSGALSGIVSGIGSVLDISDKTKKTQIRDGHDIVNHVFSKVNPKTFKYKSDSGEDPNKSHVGILAQDLEKTPLGGAVVDTPEGKCVDIKQLSFGNTAMIGELNGKLEKIMKYMKAAK